MPRYTTIAGGTKSYAIPCRGSACQKPSPIYQHIGKRAFATKQNATNHVVSEAAATKAGPKATHPENKGKIVEQTRNATDMAIIKQLMRYVWPKDDAGVKARVIIALSLLVGGKLLNVQVPFFFKNVIDSLNITFTDDMTLLTVCGAAVIGYGLARLGASAFQELRNAVFAAVAQKAIRRIARNVFYHLHQLDMSFHLTRQTGGLNRAIDRGTKGISFLLSSIVFHVLPTALEISMVCGILAYNFGTSYAAVTFSTIAAYTAFTVITTSWRTKFRKQANAADNEAATTAVDSLINFEAVKYFNNEKYETEQYDKSLQKYEESSLKIATSLAALNAGQNAIFSSALTVMMFLSAQGVMNGTLTIGEVVMVNQLVFQLSMPLNFLGSVYRELRQSLIDMDTMFNLENQNATITDAPDARDLIFKGGEIRFENVTFGYHPERPILKNVSFVVNSGHKVAFVGPSGCGFYEPQQGNIYIDGQNIRNLKLESLRKVIGVVPQDTTLFNNTIYHNIRYGRIDATEQEVYDAARRAEIHDTIMALPDKYETKVGERGLMLSGGEKQRVSLARSILKKSPIVFLDEATAALDTHTEQALLSNIRSILKDSKTTSLHIAHRLRTVADADKVIVLKDGHVAEEGRHEDLVDDVHSVYREMWNKQENSEVFLATTFEDRPSNDAAPAA
ncbi:unnamed protein product [Umbelopsis vinacea]